MRALRVQPETREQAIARFRRAQEDARFLPRIAPAKPAHDFVRDLSFFAGGMFVGVLSVACLIWGLR